MGIDDFPFEESIAEIRRIAEAGKKPDLVTGALPPLAYPRDDFIAGIEIENLVGEVIDRGGRDVFTWTPDTPATRQANVDAAHRWIQRQKAELRASFERRRAQADTKGEHRYAEGTLAGCARDVAEAETERTRTLYKKAFKLGLYVSAELLDRGDVEHSLLDAAEICGLVGDYGAKECKRHISNGLNGAVKSGLPPNIPEQDWATMDKQSVGQESKPENNGQAGEFDDDETPVYADRLLTRSMLLTLPDPEPLIDNTLDQGTTALLYGKWGTAKTFIALDWGLSVATNRDWQNRASVQRRVLYVVGEGAFGFKGRIAAWEMGWHTKISDDSLSILPEPVNLTRPLDVANLAALIDWGGYSFVILDTLARCMVAADENSAKDCGMVVDAMTRLLARTPGGRGVVLGVHHAGKDGKTLRGSSAFESGADTVYFTSRDEGWLTLTREKRKDGPENDHHVLKLDPMPGSESCVISVSREGETNNDRAGILLSQFRSHFTGIGATATQLLSVADMPRATFFRALSDLVKRGDLVNTGTDKRPFYKESS